MKTKCEQNQLNTGNVYDIKKYAENKSIATAQKKERKKELIQNGEKEKLRLYFFSSILDSMKISYFELSRISGFSQQLISWWITTDDCKYSNIVNILESINIRLSPSFEALSRAERKPGTFQFQPNDEFINMLMISSEKKEILVKSIRNKAKLSFLARFILLQEISLTSFCKTVGIKYSILYRWLMNDDIMISSLYQVAEKMGQRLIWKIEPLNLPGH